MLPAGGKMRNANRGKRFAARQLRQQPLFQALVLAAGDALTSAGPLRDDERRREARGGQRMVPARELLIVPALPAPPRIDEPFEHTIIGAQAQLLCRPTRRA